MIFLFTFCSLFFFFLFFFFFIIITIITITIISIIITTTTRAVLQQKALEAISNDLTQVSDSSLEIDEPLKFLAINAGEIIIHEGDYVDTFYIILSGEIELINDQDQSTKILYPKDYFGTAVFSEAKFSHSTIRALGQSEVKLLAIHSTALQKILINPNI